MFLNAKSIFYGKSRSNANGRSKNSCLVFRLDYISIFSGEESDKEEQDDLKAAAALVHQEILDRSKEIGKKEQIRVHELGSQIYDSLLLEMPL